MGVKWIKSEQPGIRFYEHPSRKHGPRRDRYFSLRYRFQGKQHEEGLGWASQGWNTKKAAARLAELQEAHRTGQGAKSLREARETAAAQDKASTENKKREERDNKPFSSIFQEYFQRAKGNKAASSLVREEQLFRLWLEPVIGKKPLHKIAPTDIERIKKLMSDKGRTPRSVEYCLAIARQIFNYAITNDIFKGFNPVSRVKIPRKDNQRLRFLTYSEASTLLDSLKIRSNDLYTQAVLSLHCGLRAGEIFNLRWSNIDFERRIIHVIDPKGGENRVAYMTTTVNGILKERHSSGPACLVFTSSKNTRIIDVSNTFKETVKALGLNDGVKDPRERVVFHTLRHTFASWLVEQGINIYVVKKLMGHKTLAMTERYAKLRDDTLKEAVSLLESCMDRNCRNNVINIAQDNN